MSLSAAQAAAATNQVMASMANAQVQQASAAAAISAQQQFIINNFKGQIYISNQLDVQDTPLYDTITYPAAATINTPNSQWFSNVVQATSGKTVAQTNMQQAQKLDAPEAFAVFGLRLGWSEDILRSDLQTLLNSWAYEFQLGQKNYQRANIRHFASGWGISGFSTRTAESVYTNGWPSRDAMHILAVKLVIANQMSFYAQLNGSAQQVLSGAGAGLIFVNELVGLYATRAFSKAASSRIEAVGGSSESPRFSDFTFMRRIMFCLRRSFVSLRLFVGGPQYFLPPSAFRFSILWSALLALKAIFSTNAPPISKFRAADRSNSRIRQSTISTSIMGRFGNLSSISPFRWPSIASANSETQSMRSSPTLRDLRFPVSRSIHHVLFASWQRIEKNFSASSCSCGPSSFMGVTLSDASRRRQGPFAPVLLDGVKI